MGANVNVHEPPTLAGACGMALTATTESSSAQAQNAASHTVVFFILESPQFLQSCMIGLPVPASVQEPGQPLVGFPYNRRIPPKLRCELLILGRAQTA
jgi:hypothetical protein